MVKLEETMKNVSMYTLSTCPWCQKTKKYFTDHNIPFNYVDYDLQPAQEQEKIEQEMKKRGAVRFRFPGCSSATTWSSAGTLRNTMNCWR